MIDREKHSQFGIMLRNDKQRIRRPEPERIVLAENRPCSALTMLHFFECMVTPTRAKISCKRGIANQPTVASHFFKAVEQSHDIMPMCFTSSNQKKLFFQKTKIPTEGQKTNEQKNKCTNSKLTSSRASHPMFVGWSAGLATSNHWNPCNGPGAATAVVEYCHLSRRLPSPVAKKLSLN